jgi:hypothetical protein
MLQRGTVHGFETPAAGATALVAESRAGAQTPRDIGPRAEALAGDSNRGLAAG